MRMLYPKGNCTCNQMNFSEATYVPTPQVYEQESIVETKEIEEKESKSNRFLNYEKDYEIAKGMYSKLLQTIQKEVDEECDKLEFDGSGMHNERLDKVQVNYLVDVIFDRIKLVDGNETVESVEIKSYPNYNSSCENCPRYPYARDYSPQPYGTGGFLKNLVEVMLYNEMMYRRYRYRNHKNWY